MKGCVSVEVVKRGRPQRGWSKKFKCTGSGNGGGGCSAILLVSEYDIYITESYHHDGSSETYYTFCCVECGVETDINDYRKHPPQALGRKPSEAEKKRIANQHKE